MLLYLCHVKAREARLSEPNHQVDPCYHHLHTIQPNHKMVYPSSSAESLSQSLSRLYSQDEADLNESGRSVNSPFFQEGNSSELSEDEEHTNVVSSSSAVGAAAVGPNARFKAVTIGMIAAQKRAKKPQVQVNSSDYLLPTDMEVAVWKAVAGKIALAEENKDLNGKFVVVALMCYVCIVCIGELSTNIILPFTTQSTSEQ